MEYGLNHKLIYVQTPQHDRTVKTTVKRQDTINQFLTPSSSSKDERISLNCIDTECHFDIIPRDVNKTGQSAASLQVHLSVVVKASGIQPHFPLQYSVYSRFTSLRSVPALLSRMRIRIRSLTATKFADGSGNRGAYIVGKLAT